MARDPLTALTGPVPFSSGRMPNMAPRPVLSRLRSICLAWPEVTERLSHGAPTWFVRDKNVFVTFWAQGHHDIDPASVVRPRARSAGGSGPGAAGALLPPALCGP